MKTNFIKNHAAEPAVCLTLALIVCITFLFGLWAYSSPSFIKQIDLFFYDQAMTLSANETSTETISIVDIDETSLSAVGQWPWPRYRLAQMIKTISDMGPRVIGLDILLPEPDRTSLKNIQQQFQTDFNLTLEFTGAPSSLGDNDGYLASIFQKTSIVGARYFYFDHFNTTPACTDNAFKITDKSGLLSLHRATGVLCNLPPLEAALDFTGFTNNPYDDDGLLRKTPLLIEFQGEIFTHLSLSTFLKANKIDRAEVLKDALGIYIKAGKHKIPVAEDGSVQLRFNGPSRSHTYISAVDILNHTVSASEIKNRIVLIGSSAVGLNDTHQTLFDAQFPGVETHAVILSSIYDKNQIILPAWTDHLVFCLCLLTGLLTVFIFWAASGPAVLFLGTFAWTFILVMMSLAAYFRLSIFISPALPATLSIAQFSFVSFVRFAAARRAALVWFKKLANSQQLTMETIVSLVETRDPETGQHIQRTQNYARALARALKKKGLYPDILTDHYIEILFLSVPLHDIGKVGIPDRILLKTDRLTDEEFELMKLHSSYGRDTLLRAASRVKGDNYLKIGAEIAGSHHERWDGKGYPEGLAGETIPLSGRIMAICDVYDALISRRCYKPPFSHDRSMAIIQNEKGTAFDPAIVDTFVSIEPQIISITDEFKNSIEQAPDHIKKIYMGTPAERTIGMQDKKILILDYSVDRKASAMIKQWLPEKVPIASFFIDTEASFPADLIDKAFTHVIHTGSALSINTDAPFTPRAVSYIRKLRDQGMSQMGICYGHQLICRALLGKKAVRSAPNGFEAGWEDISFLNDAQTLFNVNQTERVWQHHFDEVCDLPEGSILLATNSHTRVQAYVNFEHHLLGTQFHPEFEADSGNDYFLNDRKFIEENNVDVDEIIKKKPTFDAGKIFFNYFFDQV